MLKTSPKMRWLLPKLFEWKAAGKKVTILCVHRLTQWFIERVCLLFGGFDFLSLTSELKHETMEGENHKGVQRPVTKVRLPPDYLSRCRDKY